MNENGKNKHKEEEWVKVICEQLKDVLDKDKYIIKTCVKLVHKISLNNYMEVDNNDEIHFTDIDLTTENLEKRDMYFNVDLFIGERAKNNHIIPRVVIEAKYGGINTHDPITYSYKAELHKMLYPGLRYGLIIGNYIETHKEENCYIPIRCVEFGDNFDFIFLFKGKEKDKKLDKEELDKFVEIINDNLKISKELEKFLIDKDRKCWYIAKDIKFGENNNTTDK